VADLLLDDHKQAADRKVVGIATLAGLSRGGAG
jgi:hypothetical protein